MVLQTCQTPIRPITPNNLLDSICWSISESTSAASIYTDSFSVEDPSENHTSIFFYAKGDGKDSEASFSNSTRPLTERLLLTPCGLSYIFSLRKRYNKIIASHVIFSQNLLQREIRVDI